MLVLTRKENESITVVIEQLSFNISIKNIKGHSVQLAFDAPREVSIVRTELLTPNTTEQ